MQQCAEKRVQLDKVSVQEGLKEVRNWNNRVVCKESNVKISTHRNEPQQTELNDFSCETLDAFDKNTKWIQLFKHKKRFMQKTRSTTTVFISLINSLIDYKTISSTNNKNPSIQTDAGAENTDFQCSGAKRTFWKDFWWSQFKAQRNTNSRPVNPSEAQNCFWFLWA